MKQAYINHEFRGPGLRVVEQADAICRDYAGQGYNLTLRQLYYQFVSKGLIANKDSEYDRLGSIINKARLCGLIDWNHLEDRTRNLQALQHYESPQDAIEHMARSYDIDLWEDQTCYVEVWVEKEALAGVIERVADRHDVPFFSCRGYVSQSEMHAAGERLLDMCDMGKQPVVIHLGDHDPSGIDMTRDIKDRLDMFMDGAEVEVDRIALNMDQVRRYNPPPNPAKITDSRAGGYIADYGRSSWELDALDPATLDALIEETINKYKDSELFDARVALKRRQKAGLYDLSLRFKLGEAQEEEEGE